MLFIQQAIQQQKAFGELAGWLRIDGASFFLFGGLIGIRECEITMAPPLQSPNELASSRHEAQR